MSVVRTLYTENIISKETFDEIQTSGGSLTDGPLRALSNTVSADPNKLRVLGTVLLQSKKTVHVGQSILEDIDSKLVNLLLQNVNIYLNFTAQTVFHISPNYQREFDEMRGRFGRFFDNITSLIKSAVFPSSFMLVKKIKASSCLRRFKRFLGRTFEELKPQLGIARSFHDVMDVVKKKCTIINISCLETIISHYSIDQAMELVTAYHIDIEKFCNKVKVNLMTLMTNPILKCETIEFTLAWKTDEHTLKEIRNVLSVLFGDNGKRVIVGELREGNSIIVTCYAPRHIVDILLIEAKKNVNLVKEMELIKLTIGYHTVWEQTRDKVRDK